MKNIQLIVLLLSLSACSTRMKYTSVVAGAGAVVGAGVGYSVVHHGKDKKYQTTNTIATSAIFAVLAGGLTYWHLRSLDQQKIEIAGEFSRATLLDEDSRNTLRLFDAEVSVDDQSVKLDSITRWVLPVFRKREVRAKRAEDSFVSSHHRWEVLKPGFFVSHSQAPELFKEKK